MISQYLEAHLKSEGVHSAGFPTAVRAGQQHGVTQGFIILAVAAVHVEVAVIIPTIVISCS